MGLKNSPQAINMDFELSSECSRIYMMHHICYTRYLTLPCEAPRAKRVEWALSLKCLKTNLESQGALCISYRFILLCTVYCTEMAHKSGPTFLCIPKQGYRPSINMSKYAYMIYLKSYISQ